MAPCVPVDLVEPVEELPVSGRLVGMQTGERRLVVHPPELHVVLQFQMRLAQSIHEVEDAAEFVVPAEFQGVGDDPRNG